MLWHGGLAQHMIILFGHQGCSYESIFFLHMPLSAFVRT